MYHSNETTDPEVRRIRDDAKLAPVFEALRLSIQKLDNWSMDVVNMNGGLVTDMSAEGAPEGSMLMQWVSRRLPLLSPKYVNDPEAVELVNGYFERFPLMQNCFYLEEGEDHGAIVSSCQDIRFFGEACAEAVPRANELVGTDASSYHLSGFFAEVFLRRIFERFTEKSTPNIYLGEESLTKAGEEELLVYREGKAWDACLLPAKERSEDIRRYTPSSDFSVHYRANGCPCLIGEVVSDRIKEEDRFRMLAQGIAAARAGSVLIKNSEFVLMAIYVSADLVATRYFLQVNSDGRSVDIAKENFVLTNELDVSLLLRELFNWRAYALEEVAPRFQNDDRLRDINHRLRHLKSMGAK